MEEQKTTNEINLIDIIIAVGRWIGTAVKSTFRFLGILLQLLFRNKISTAVITMVAVAVALYFARPSNRQFHVDAMAALHGTKAETVKEVGRQLSNNSAIFRETALGGKLGLPDSVANKVKSIEFFDVIDLKKDSIPDRVDFKRNFERTDTSHTVMKNRLYIRLTTYGVKNAEKIGEKILNYLNENQTIKSDFDVYCAQMRNQIRIAEQETRRIDSLARKKYFDENPPHIQFQNNQLLVGNQYTQLFYNDMLYLQRNRTKWEQQLTEAKAPVVVASGFIIDPIHINNWKLYLLQGLLAGLAISVFVAFALENYKKWLRFLKQ